MWLICDCDRKQVAVLELSGLVRVGWRWPNGRNVGRGAMRRPVVLTKKGTDALPPDLSF